MLHQFYSRLPPRIRAKGKEFLGASGHSRGVLDAMKARKDAQGRKRLDNTLLSVTECLGRSYLDELAGATVVDFGAGYVPMDGIAMWLLGAERVVAVDYNEIADFRAVARGVRKADLARAREILEHLSPDVDWPSRLVTLVEAARRDAVADVVPIEYLAPLDVTSTPEALPRFDLLWSLSVLEHVPPSRIVALLAVLSSRARESGVQLHRVDLCDHHDFDHDPYRFLAADANFDAEHEADVRGNGMTSGDWATVLSAHPHLELTVVDRVPGRPHLLPDAVRAGVAADGVDDFVTIGPVR